MSNHVNTDMPSFSVSVSVLEGYLTIIQRARVVEPIVNLLSNCHNRGISFNFRMFSVKQIKQ